MKQIKIFLCAFLIMGCAVNNLVAQQGNVVAGGDATGSGYSMSYSIGQTDYLMYSSEQGSLSFGLQQTWPVSIEPPLTLEISDLVISAGETLCFNAVETITVAGDGNQFIVQANSHADLIAGHSILLKNGTSVELHGSLHARISTDWCLPQQSLLASFSENPEPVTQSIEPWQRTSFFTVYPNPTTGDFTLELLEFEEQSNIQLEIFSAQGLLVSAGSLAAQRRHNLTLADNHPGFYIIRVTKNQEMGFVKIIKQ
jgi:hypothetical protein